MAESWCAASGPALQELWEEPDQNATALLASKDRPKHVR